MVRLFVVSMATFVLLGCSARRVVEREIVGAWSSDKGGTLVLAADHRFTSELTLPPNFHVAPGTFKQNSGGRWTVVRQKEGPGFVLDSAPLGDYVVLDFIETSTSAMRLEMTWEDDEVQLFWWDEEPGGARTTFRKRK